MNLVACKGCGKSIQSDVSFCPHCGTSLGKLEKEGIYPTTERYISKSTENLQTFLNYMKNPEELEEKTKEMSREYPQIFEKQRKVTQNIIERFPEIRVYLNENPQVEFTAFIVSIPYEKEPSILQHDCLLRQLAIRQGGLVNFSVGSTQLASDLYAFDVPIWAPKRIGYELLSEQKQMVDACLPVPQRKFLYSAEPWWVCSRVFDLEGRWVNWRLLFKTEGFKEYLEEQEEVPLNFHLFSNMEYSDLFSIAGTSSDGEVLVGIHKTEETDSFKRQLNELKELYKIGREPEITTIKISWSTLEYLGLLGFSAQQLLKLEKGHFFRKTFSEKIIEGAEQKAVSDTKGVMTGSLSLAEDDFTRRLTNRVVWYETQSHQEGAVRIIHGIPRELRKEFRVIG